MSNQKDPPFKADFVAPSKTTGGTGYKKPKKGSDKPDLPRVPQTIKMSKDERRMGYMKSKGLKVDGYKADPVDRSVKTYKPAKNKFKS